MTDRVPLRLRPGSRAVHGAALAIGCLPSAASAHFFLQSYSLPIPFWMYAWGAAAALALSFVVVGLFATVNVTAMQSPLRAAKAVTREGVGLSVGRGLAVVLLLLCIVTGLFGTRNAFDNLNMTLFWIGFVLGVPYLVIFVGDFYAALNPWETIVRGVERLTGVCFKGKLAHPEALGHWPAVVLYLGFICVELLAELTPRGLSIALVFYTLINLAGSWLLGRVEWFRQGELFAVMMRLLGHMAPLERRAGRRHWRWPFLGLLQLKLSDMGLAVFILFMLSSTAFDGLHQTLPWINFYWGNLNPYVKGLLELPPRQLNEVSTRLYLVWQWLALCFSPLLYLGCFAAVAAGIGHLARSTMGVRELILRFTPSLLPIALVYHVTHYFTLLLFQAGQLVRLASDPMGLGWNLFGTADLRPAPVMVDVGTIWHVQVGLILAGHVLSVYLAHLEALRCWPQRRLAAMSQLPMLLLMLLFTAFGLWILSLPLSTA